MFPVARPRALWEWERSPATPLLAGMPAAAAAEEEVVEGEEEEEEAEEASAAP